MTGNDPDRRGLLSLAAGHMVIDACVGAVPALIPVFAVLYALSDLEASMILAASLLVSSAIQPFFGAAADRRATPAFLWGGVALAALGLAAAGLAGGYLGVLAAIVGSGLGIAAYHPEAARVANQIAGDNKATGLAWFMVGGNTGFAAGPLIAALFIPVLDERATLVFLVPGAIVSLWLLRERTRLGVPVVERPPPRADGARHSDVRGIALLLFVTSMRTWTQFVCLALVPLLLIESRGFSTSAAGLSVFYFSFAGALGTIAGAALADRAGGRVMLVSTMPLTAPLLAGFLLLDGAVSLVLFALAGFVLMASFSVTVVMGQEYMPTRLALAAGLMIGFGAIGSAPPGLALFGAIADLAGRETAIWLVCLLPPLGAAVAALLPRPPAPEPQAA